MVVERAIQLTHQPRRGGMIGRQTWNAGQVRHTPAPIPLTPGKEWACFFLPLSHNHSVENRRQQRKPRSRLGFGGLRPKWHLQQVHCRVIFGSNREKTLRPGPNPLFSLFPVELHRYGYGTQLHQIVQTPDNPNGVVSRFHRHAATPFFGVNFILQWTLKMSGAGPSRHRSENPAG